MNITLAEAVQLRSIIAKRINELVHERNNISTVTVGKGETYEPYVRTVQEVTSELEEARKEYRLLDVVMATANINNTIEWNGQLITIMEAIELAKQMRAEVTIIKSYGNRKKQERSATWRSEAENIVYALYDVEEYRQAGLKMERQVNRLSSEIDKINRSVEINFEPAKKYLGD